MIRLAIILIPCALALPYLLYRQLADPKSSPSAVTHSPDAPVDDASPRETEAAVARSAFLLEGYGTARASRSSPITAEVAGQVTALAPGLRKGEKVLRGQTLVQIQDTEYHHRFEQAQSAHRGEEIKLKSLDKQEEHCDKNLRQTREQVERMELEREILLGLKDRGHASFRECNENLIELERQRTVLQMFEQQKDLFDSRRQQISADCARMRAEVELARINLDRCTVEAPWDGDIVELKVDVGQRVQPGQLLLEMLDPIAIEVTVELPVSARRCIDENGVEDWRCTIFRESEPNTTWSGDIRRLSPDIDEAKQTFELYVDVDNAAHATKLLPGCFVRALIHKPLEEQAHAERYVPPSRDGSAGLP